MALISPMVVWKFVLMVFGAQFAAMHGTKLIQVLCAHKWDLAVKVK